MARIVPGRMTAQAPPGTVVFLIGMRVNRAWKFHRWLPVAAAMPGMLAELARQPELGLRGSAIYLGGRTILLVQYWQSAEHLTRYATAREHAHLPAWRAFNRRVRDNGDVGVFHETYVIDRHETIQVNMPAGFGLAGATTAVPVARRGQAARHRLDPAAPDEPAVAPY